ERLEFATLNWLVSSGENVAVVLPPAHGLLMVTPLATALKVSEPGVDARKVKLAAPPAPVVPVCGTAGTSVMPPDGVPLSCTDIPLIGALVVSFTVTVTTVASMLFACIPEAGVAGRQEFVALTGGVVATVVGTLPVESFAVFESTAGVICALLFT